jgi:hypothetical protein
MGMLVGACYVTTQSNRRNSVQRSSGATTGPANTVREGRQRIGASTVAKHRLVRGLLMFYKSTGLLALDYFGARQDIPEPSRV